VLHAVDFDIMNGGQKAPGINALAQFVEIERDRQSGFAVAIDNSGHLAGATHGPGGPLAGPRSCRRLDQIDGRHSFKSLSWSCPAMRIAAAASRGAMRDFSFPDSNLSTARRKNPAQV